MPDEDRQKTPAWLKVATTVIGGGLLFFIQFTVTAFSDMRERDSQRREEMAKILEQFEQLRNDDAKWGTLHEHEVKIREQEISDIRLAMEFEMLRQVWEYHTGRQVGDFPSQPGDPELDLERIRRSMNRYRMEQQQKYPNEPPTKGH